MSKIHLLAFISRSEELGACAQKTNMVEVVSEIDPELARRVMIRRLVAALPG